MYMLCSRLYTCSTRVRTRVQLECTRHVYVCAIPVPGYKCTRSTRVLRYWVHVHVYSYGPYKYPGRHHISKLFNIAVLIQYRYGMAIACYPGTPSIQYPWICVFNIDSSTPCTIHIHVHVDTVDSVDNMGYSLWSTLAGLPLATSSTLIASPTQPSTFVGGTMWLVTRSEWGEVESLGVRM